MISTITDQNYPISLKVLRKVLDSLLSGCMPILELPDNNVCI